MSEPEVSKALQKLWPPGTFAGGKGGTRQTTTVHPAPDRNGKRPAARVTKVKPPPKQRKPSKSTPGGKAQPKRSRTQKGK